MTYKILINLFLIVYCCNGFSQNRNTIQVRNQKEFDNLEVSVLSFSAIDTIYLEIEKTLPLDKSQKKLDFKNEYIYHIPNTKKSILKFYIVDGKFIKGFFKKKSTQRTFNGFYQKHAEINVADITIQHLNIDRKEIMGEIIIKLPYGFGWLNSDSVVNVNFKTRIYDKLYKKELNPVRVKSISVNPNLFSNSITMHYETCIFNRDTLNSNLKFEIGNADDLSGNLITIQTEDSCTRAEIISYDYNDIEEDKSYSYPYYKLEFNRDPFTDSDTLLIGKYLISTDSLPEKYGDPEVRFGYFKCRKE